MKEFNFRVSSSAKSRLLYCTQTAWRAISSISDNKEKQSHYQHGRKEYIAMSRKPCTHTYCLLKESKFRSPSHAKSGLLYCTQTQPRGWSFQSVTTMRSTDKDVSLSAWLEGIHIKDMDQVAILKDAIGCFCNVKKALYSYTWIA